MSIPSPTLIDQSIADLEALSAQLAGEIPSNSRAMPALPFEVRLSKEALLTISVLLPKLRAVRARDVVLASRTSSRIG